MLKTASANRLTRIKVVESGKVVKNLANASINYGQDLEQLKKMIEIAIRLSPQDPILNVDRVCIELSEGKYSEIDQKELTMIQKELFRQDASSAAVLAGKVSLKVYVSRPSGAGALSAEANATSRSSSRMASRESGDAKYEGILRPSSPFVNKRTSTPNKSRSISRPRPLPRGTSPMPNRSVGEDGSVRKLLRASAGADENRKPTNDIELVDMNAMRSAASPVKKPASAVVLRNTNKDSGEARVAAVEQIISKTWVHVEDPGSPLPVQEMPQTPMRSYLGPFSYYSPLSDRGDEVKCEAVAETHNHEDDDFLSCAGDIGNEIALDLAESISENNDSNDPNNDDNRSYVSSRSRSTIGRDSVLSTKSPRRRRSRSSSASRKSATDSAKKTPSKSKRILPRSVFPDGRTLAESTVSYEMSLRSYKHPGKNSSAKKKVTPTTMEISPMNLKAGKPTSSTKDSNRPSIGTITSQWEFMRTNFLNNSDEELEWLMVSKRDGAYTYANKKHCNAEDKYFRCLYETELFENKLKYFSGFGARLPHLLGEIALLYDKMLSNAKDEAVVSQVMGSFHRCVEYLHSVQKENIFCAFPQRIDASMRSFMTETDKFKIVRKARDLQQILTSETNALQQKLLTARKEGDEALKQMEKWSKREAEVEEYPRIMKEQEDQWMQREFAENLKALKAMRAFFPDNLLDLSVQEIQIMYLQNGGMISMELAQELKQNKLLHWLITHPEDIAYSNFLTGERKAFFENIEGLDLFELRALAVILPAKFELDPDGKKAAWRGRFFQRLKQLLDQQNGEKVKGAWDPDKNARALVPLPSLKPEQLRRPVYFFRTKEASAAKLKQYDDKLALLTKKETWLKKAESDAKEAKEEYDTVLKEMRDPEFIEYFGAEKLASVKDVAKKDWMAAEKRRKDLEADVRRLKKTIDDAPLTRDQFVQLEDDLRKFLAGKGVDWMEDNRSAVQIEGVFALEKTLVPRLKAAAKFVTAEQEALERKLELSTLKQRNTAEIESSADATEQMIGRLVDPMVPASPAISRLKETFDGSKSCNLSASLSSSRDLSALRSRPVLASANTDVLNTLNKMFAAQASPSRQATTPFRTRTPARRASVTITASVTVELKESESKEIKQTKSKLLRRMLAPTPQCDEPTNHAADAAAHRPAIKDLFASTTPLPLTAMLAASEHASHRSQDPDQSHGAERDSRSRISQAFGGMKAAMGSFLDQIRSKRKPETEYANHDEHAYRMTLSPKRATGGHHHGPQRSPLRGNDAPPPSRPLPAPPAHVAAESGTHAKHMNINVLTKAAGKSTVMSFLDEIKAKRGQQAE